MYNAESMKEVAGTEIIGIHMDREIRKLCPLPADVIKKCDFYLKSLNNKSFESGSYIQLECYKPN